MAYREKLTSVVALSMFAPQDLVTRVDAAIKAGQKVEMEHSSITDAGPDESRVLIEGRRVFVIPGY